MNKQPNDLEADSSNPSNSSGAATKASGDCAQIAAERDELQNRLLRAQADFDNFRKRSQKEAEQEHLFRALPLARDLLPGLDNLRRAVESAEKTADAAQLLQGVRMVLKQFDDILAKHALTPIDAVGKPFDPNLHQALQQVPTSDKPPMTVLNEYERGYTLHDRVVRPSTVVVAAPPAEKGRQPEAAGAS